LVPTTRHPRLVRGESRTRSSREADGEVKRFTEEQIIAVLKESEAGAKAKDLFRRGLNNGTQRRAKNAPEMVPSRMASSNGWSLLGLELGFSSRFLLSHVGITDDNAFLGLNCVWPNLRTATI
jgi:hypothetical protein